jgi:hypothetical protein
VTQPAITSDGLSSAQLLQCNMGNLWNFVRKGVTQTANWDITHARKNCAKKQRSAAQV